MKLFSFSHSGCFNRAVRQPSLKKNNGFTLIEVLIGIVIMGIAISMVSVAISQSVRNQERMQHLLSLYQVALTSRSQVVEQIKNNELTGSYQTGNVRVEWVAELIDEKDEAQVFMADFGYYSESSFVVRYYKIQTIVESPHARRVYYFDQMLEQHKSDRNSGFLR